MGGKYMHEKDVVKGIEIKIPNTVSPHTPQNGENYKLIRSSVREDVEQLTGCQWKYKLLHSL